MRLQVEEVTPALAEKWLGLSAGNRHVNDDYVLALAISMEAGEWDETASEIVFDEGGALVDGHHRLRAVILHGKPVRMGVKRGASEKARLYIDTGRARSITDLHSMYRPDVSYPLQRRAALSICLGLAMGRGPTIRTLPQLDHWAKFFREGIEAVIAATFQAGHRQEITKAFGRGPILGAFAFADKRAPEKVRAFHVRCLVGGGLEDGDPALVLRTIALAGSAGSTGAERMDVSRRVLNLVHSELVGAKVKKISVSPAGRDYFMEAHGSKRFKASALEWARGGKPE